MERTFQRSKFAWTTYLWASCLVLFFVFLGLFVCFVFALFCFVFLPKIYSNACFDKFRAPWYWKVYLLMQKQRTKKAGLTQFRSSPPPSCQLTLTRRVVEGSWLALKPTNIWKHRCSPEPWQRQARRSCDKPKPEGETPLTVWTGGWIYHCLARVAEAAVCDKCWHRMPEERLSQTGICYRKLPQLIFHSDQRRWGRDPKWLTTRILGMVVIIQRQLGRSQRSPLRRQQMFSSLGW